MGARADGRSRSRDWWIASAVALAALTGFMVLFRGRLDKSHVALLYLLLVLGGSARGGRALGLTLAGISFLLFDLFFLKPYYTLSLADPLDWLVLATFLLTSVVATELFERQRRQAQLAAQRASELDRLGALGAETLNAARADQALGAIAGVMRAALGVDRCELFVRGEGSGREDLRAVADTTPGAAPASAGAGAAGGGLLAYVIDHGQAAVERQDGTLHLIEGGLAGSEQRLEDLRAFAVPLAIRGQTVGALRASAAGPFAVTGEHRRVLGALAYYAALGIERRRLEHAEGEAEALRRADAVKDALLATVSHDLRTPLTTIRGIAHEIRAGADAERAAVIEDEVDRLQSFVDDLLELSQLQAGALPVHAELNTVDELIGAALQRTEALLRTHPLTIDVADRELLVGRFDFIHALRIITNLLENAAKYSAADAPIRVSACRVGDRLRITVADSGPGIPEADRERVFEPFYRSATRPRGVRGAGLGLSIARQLAHAQGGRLQVESVAGSGSAFTVELEAAEVPPLIRTAVPHGSAATTVAPSRTIA